MASPDVWKEKNIPEDYWENLWPGKPLNVDNPMVRTGEVWCNEKCQVLVYDYPPDSLVEEKGMTRPEWIKAAGLTGWPSILELSLKLNTREPWNDWRDFYRIKSEICGTACWAMQMYPSQNALLDTANQYHMYVLSPDSQDMWPVRNLQQPVTDYSDTWSEYMGFAEEEFGKKEVQAMRANSRQRPWYEHHKCDDLPLIGPAWGKRGWFLDSEGRIHGPEGSFGMGTSSKNK